MDDTNTKENKQKDTQPIIPKEGPSNILPKAFGNDTSSHLIKGFAEEVSEKLGGLEEPAGGATTTNAQASVVPVEVSQALHENTISSTQQTSIAPPDDPNAPTLEEVLHLPKPKRNVFKILFLMVFILGFAFFIGSSIAIALIANNVLKIDNVKVKYLANQLYYQMPIVPKKAEHVIQATILSHIQKPSANVQATLTTTSLDFEEFTGMSGALKLSGPISYMDNDLKFNLNVAYPEVVSVDALYTNEKMYFGFDKFPTFLVSFFAAPDINVSELENIWVFLEPPTETSESSNTTRLHFDNKEALQVTFNKVVVPNLQMSSDLYKDVPVHKVSLKVTNELLNTFFDTYIIEADVAPNSEKPRFLATDFDIVLYIDKKSDYIKHIDVTSDLSAEHPSESPYELFGALPDFEDLLVTVSIDVDSIGDNFQIEEPSEFVTLTEYGKKFFEIILSSTVPPELGDEIVELPEDDDTVNSYVSPFGDLLD